eukprot:1735409-Pyramimonas_sp.AAC.1
MLKCLDEEGDAYVRLTRTSCDMHGRGSGVRCRWLPSQECEQAQPSNATLSHSRWLHQPEWVGTTTLKVPHRSLLNLSHGRWSTLCLRVLYPKY